MTGWTDWSDWSGDWSDWSSDWATDWASDWAGDWGDYSLAALQSNTTLQYSPVSVPKHVVYIRNPSALEKAREVGVTVEELARLGITNPQILVHFSSAKKGVKKSSKDSSKASRKSREEPEGYREPPIPQEVIHGLAPGPKKASEAEVNQTIRRLIAAGKSPEEIAREVKLRYGVDVSFKPVEVTVNTPVRRTIPQPETSSGKRSEPKVQDVLESLEVVKRTMWDALRAGVPALNVASAISGISIGTEYTEKRRKYEARVKALEGRKRDIDRLIAEGVQQGKAEWVTEGGEKKLVVKDEKLYNELDARIRRYNYAVKEAEKLRESLKSMEKEIIPPYSAKDYPLIGRQIYEAEKSAVEWIRQKSAPYGAVGEFAAGLGIGAVSLVELPALLMNLATKPSAVGASMTIHAVDRPVEFAGSLVGAVLAGKVAGGVVGRAGGQIRSILTEPKPVRQTIIVGDKVVYKGKPLNRPLVTESTRIESVKPVNVRVERSAVEYQGFRAEMAEVESGAELNVAATPVRAAKVRWSRHGRLR